jgi:hypothetical protein
MIELLHSQALLAQIVNCEAAPTWNPLPRKADGPMRNLLDATECAVSEVVEFDKFRIEALRIGTIEERFISVQRLVSKGRRVCS